MKSNVNWVRSKYMLRVGKLTDFDGCKIKPNRVMKRKGVSFFCSRDTNWSSCFYAAFWILLLKIFFDMFNVLYLEIVPLGFFSPPFIALLPTEHCITNVFFVSFGFEFSFINILSLITAFRSSNPEWRIKHPSLRRGYKSSSEAMAETSWIPIWFSLGILGLFGLKWVMKRVNVWIYESKLGEKQLYLPPGDLGWPFIGNMWSFLRAFKTSDPESFVRNFTTRYGVTGVYKAHMFGNPSVIVTTPETCRRVLTDDDAFGPGWPRSTMELIGRKSFIGISIEEHKRLRRLTAAPVNGHEALSIYIKYIEENVISALETWSKMGEIEFLTRVRKLTFKIIMYIFLSSESEHVMEALEREYTNLNYGVRAMAVNLPGFAYHKALKARKKLVATLQSIVDDRRNQKKQNMSTNKKDMLDNLIDVKDENGRILEDEEIIDVLLMYLNAGHESSGHTIMWATIFLQEHPEFFQKAKEEQERIVKRMAPGQKGLTLKDTRDMEYLSQVIDETLRVITFSLTAFRETKTDVHMNGYIIPKGWKVLTWFRTVHLDPEIYPDPKKFDPSRWEGYAPKAGTFLPFGLGRHLCPGNDLAKLEISIFLHHFLLKYRVERRNPGCPVMFLPHTRPKDNCLARITKTTP